MWLPLLLINNSYPCALLGLAEEHVEVLQGDTRISSVKYCPFTKSCSPGASKQRLYPNQDWLKDVV